MTHWREQTLIYHGKLANQIRRLAAVVVKLFILEGEKPENPEKNPQSEVRTNELC